jgi:phosphohistidine phosphatase
MVTIYLCRHGIAEEAAGRTADEERELTGEGVKKFRKAAKGFLRLTGVDGISQVVSSPLARARQTAEIVAELLDAKGRVLKVRQTETLAPDGNLSGFLKLVRGMKGGVVAVGHEPLLSQWIGKLCFGTMGRVRMGKGAIAAIELQPAGLKGELLWLMQPGELREAR